MSRLQELMDELCPDGVEYKTLNDVCSKISAGGDVPADCNKGQTEPTSDRPFPVISNGKTGNDIYGYSSTYKVEGPAVTISARGTIGFHTVRTGKFTPIVRLITLIVNESIIDYRFLNYYLDIAIFAGTRGGIPQITVPTIKKISVPIPPFEVQNEIVRILDSFTLLEAELEARRKQYAFFREKLLNFDDLSSLSLQTERNCVDSNRVKKHQSSCRRRKLSVLCTFSNTTHLRFF